MEAPRCGLFDFLNPGLRHAVIWGYLLAIIIAFHAGPGDSQRTTKSFKCPQQFGYFQDSSDCNKYYICVFGDALQEKCTPGLYFNNELRMCDWPRNVKTCNSDGKSGREQYVHQYGTSTSSPRSRSRSSSSRSSNSKDDSIPSSNSISVPLQSSRASNQYNPPISRESYMAAARNSTIYRPPSSITPRTTTTTTTTTAPRLRPPVSTSAPVTFRPQPIRATSRTYTVQSVPREPLRPLPSTYGNKRKDYDDSEYFEEDDYEDDEEDDDPRLILNQDIRKTTDTYVRPIEPPSSYQQNRHQSTYINSRTPARPQSSNSPSTTDHGSRNQHVNSAANSVSDSSRISSGRNSVFNNQRGRSGNSNRGDNSLSDSSASIDSEEFSTSYGQYNNQRAPQTNRERYSSGDVDLTRHPGRSQQSLSTHNSQGNRNSNSNSALSSTYSNRPRESDSLIRLRPQAVRGPPKQSLNNGRDSLDAQYGTNPRSISLPDVPHRLNSFISNNDNRKAERNQPNPNKPQVTSTRYLSPPRPSHEQSSSSQEFDDYPEYYYDDEYYDDDDEPLPTRGPKVVFRVHRPPSSTTSTTLRPPPTTTRRTTSTTTTRRPATTRPAKRGLPFGISRPATKSPLRVGPKDLPRLPSRPSPIYSTPRALVTAEKCTAQKCRLPDCRCASSDIPGGLPASQVPQIVLVTFDDAVNDLNYELYQELFEGRKNPNGCPILGTFYVSHEWTDYGMVQTLYSKGHEMASHSITHSHGEKFTVGQWHKEIHGQREILHLYGGVKLEDVRGMRAPFLQVGGNNMFEMLYESNFTYDSSMPVLDNNPPFYPYTLDYNIGHECMIPPCPNKAFPGLWEVGMVMWIDYRGGRCSMGDACANPDNSEEVYQMLLKNFNRHYNSNRAPFGLYYHAAWFTTQHFRRGYMKFIEEINSKSDVYIVTNWQAIQWIRDPTPLSRIKSFAPWQCPKDLDKPGPCHHPTTCNIGYKGGSRNLKTCQPCPSTFPWTGRTGFDEVYGK